MNCLINKVKFMIGQNSGQICCPLEKSALIELRYFTLPTSTDSSILFVPCSHLNRISRVKFPGACVSIAMVHLVPKHKHRDWRIRRAWFWRVHKLHPIATIHADHGQLDKKTSAGTYTLTQYLRARLIISSSLALCRYHVFIGRPVVTLFR